MADISATTWSVVDANNDSPAPLGWDPGVMLPTEVEPTAQAMMGAIKRFWSSINATITTTGSAGTYQYTAVNATYPTAYHQGEVFFCKADKISAGNDLMQVNGLGTKKMYNGATLVRIAAGAIISGQFFSAYYDSALDSAAGGFQIFDIPKAATSVTQQVFLTPGANTYTPTVGTSFLIAQLKGGGAGGYAQTGGSIGGGGGGEGEDAVVVLTAAQIGASKTLTIGAKGTGAASGGAAATAGGTTSLATTGTSATAVGGAIGLSSGVGGLGGTGGTGTGFHNPGGQGMNGSVTGTGTTYQGGNGGGGGGRGGLGNLDNGQAAARLGAGGGGGGFAGGMASNGGDGAPGYAIITEFA